MLKTIDRYVIKEVVPPFLLTLLIFTFILELPPVMEELERLVAKGVSWRTAGHILLLLTPQALGLTIPMALLVALLIGLGRMSDDREGVALLACGVSPYRLLLPVMVLAGAATAATAYIMIEAIPDANQKYREILFEILTQKVESDVKPRVFYQDFPNWVVYPRDEAPPGQPGWKDVLVANTSNPQAPVLYLAERGELRIDRAERRVELILSNGTQYDAADGAARTLRFPEHNTFPLDPDSVFPPTDLGRGVTEKTIAQLKADISTKEKAARQAADPLAFSTHNEVMAIHAKFSIPAACLVFAFNALALGLTVSRGGRMGGFVVGIGVIFAYYIVMFLAESLAKGHRMPAELARWVPNIVLGIFGILALMWRAGHAEGRLPFGLTLPEFLTRRFRRDPASTRKAPAVTAPGRRGTVVVLRIPHVPAPLPGLIDRYISRIYLRVAGLSFLALLGLFYISTFIDKSDKVFKGTATTSMVGQLLVYMTPQFIYYVIPIAALLSALVTFGLLTRSSELTVMKACGVSLYRAAASVVVLALMFSGILYALEQRIKASANRQAEIIDAKIRGRLPRNLNPLNRRWVTAADGAIYHYTYFDAQRKELNGLLILHPRTDTWELASQTYIQRATYRAGEWHADQGWSYDYTKTPFSWRALNRERVAGLAGPDLFSAGEPVPELMTVRELRNHIAELARSGFNVVPLTVDLQSKIAFPFVTVVMTLLAVPFGVSTGRRGALYGIGLAIVIALTYWIIISAFIAIGKGGLLTPGLAAWAPNILAVGIAVYLFLRART
jgi:lipopolysaccharide export system permease protein